MGFGALRGGGGVPLWGMEALPSRRAKCSGRGVASRRREAEVGAPTLAGGAGLRRNAGGVRERSEGHDSRAVRGPRSGHAGRALGRPGPAALPPKLAEGQAGGLVARSEERRATPEGRQAGGELAWWHRATKPHLLVQRRGSLPQAVSR